MLAWVVFPPISYGREFMKWVGINNILYVVVWLGGVVHHSHISICIVIKNTKALWPDWWSRMLLLIVFICMMIFVMSYLCIY